MRTTRDDVVAIELAEHHKCGGFFVETMVDQGYT